MQLRHVACAICGADDTSALRTVGTLTYVRCNRCTLVYVNPQPRAGAIQNVYEKRRLKAWFKRWTYSFRKMADLKNFEYQLHRGELLMYEVVKYKPQGRLLDVGCNRGFILAAAAAWGWETYGIEIVPWVTQIVEREFGSTIFHARLREIDPPLQDRFFDAVTMIDIIEHCHEPLRDLQEVARILKDDGVLLLNTVDIGSSYARVMGERWTMEKPEEHLSLFDRRTLPALLEKAGLEVMTIQPSKGRSGEMEVHIRKTDRAGGAPASGNQ